MPFFLSNLANQLTGNFFDLLLQALYLFSNPFRICRRFLEKKGEKNIYAYGETPLSAWGKIAALAEIKAHDVFCDFGCGRGRLCFWTASNIGCTTIGIDWVPTFIRRARLLAFLFGLKKMRFKCAKITDVPLEQVTVAYLYTFHADEEQLDFSRLPVGARVISLSEPLPYYRFSIKATAKITFPWGETEVFVHSI